MAAAAGECSICLSNFKEPVSIPCGHVYCSQCLTKYVNTTRNNNLTSSCPACRTVFNIVTPELTYLPGQYHKYVLPSVRRVYIDTTLQAKLAQSEARVKVLEKDKEVLIGQCERHMAASRAHAAGEKDAVLRLRKANAEKDRANDAKGRAQDDTVTICEDFEYLKAKYEKLKRYCRERDEDDTGNQTVPAVKKRKNRVRFDLPDSSIDQSANVSVFPFANLIPVQFDATPSEAGEISKRKIRPLPSRVANKSPRRRISAPSQPATVNRDSWRLTVCSDR